MEVDGKEYRGMMSMSGVNEEDQKESESYSYVYRKPVQPPICPNYYTYQKKFQGAS